MEFRARSEVKTRRRELISSGIALDTVLTADASKVLDHKLTSFVSGVGPLRLGTNSVGGR